MTTSSIDPTAADDSQPRRSADLPRSQRCSTASRSADGRRGRSTVAFLVAEAGDRIVGVVGHRVMLRSLRAAAFDRGARRVARPRTGSTARRTRDRRGGGARNRGAVSADDDGRALLPELRLRRDDARRRAERGQGDGGVPGGVSGVGDGDDALP